MSRKWDCTSACVPLLKERKVQSKAPAASMQLQKKGAMQHVHRASKRKTLTCLLVGYCIIRCSSCILEWQSYIPLKGTTYTPARCVVHFYFFPPIKQKRVGCKYIQDSIFVLVVCAYSMYSCRSKGRLRGTNHTRWNTMLRSRLLEFQIQLFSGQVKCSITPQVLEYKVGPPPLSKWLFVNYCFFYVRFSIFVVSYVLRYHYGLIPLLFFPRKASALHKMLND